MTLLVDHLHSTLRLSVIGRDPEWVSLCRYGGPFCPSEPLIPAVTPDLHNMLLSFQTVNFHLSLSVSPFCNLAIIFSQSQSAHAVRLPPPSLPPLPPSLPVVLRPLSLTLPDSRLKRRNRVRERLTMMLYNKPCLLPNCSSDPFFCAPLPPLPALPLQNPPHVSVHPCPVCMQTASFSSPLWSLGLSGWTGEPEIQDNLIPAISNLY